MLRGMSLTDRAVLRAGRARWYDEMRWIIAAGVATAYNPPEREEADDGEE